MSQELLSSLLLWKSLMENLHEFPFKCTSASDISQVAFLVTSVSSSLQTCTSIHYVYLFPSHFGSLHRFRNFISLSKFPMVP